MPTADYRIKPGFTAAEMIAVLSDGRQDVATVLAAMFRRSDEIDPECCEGAYFGLLRLDMLGVYGDRIAKLHHGLGRGSITITLALLRSVELGIIDESDLIAAIDGTADLNVGELAARVQSAVGGYDDLTFKLKS